jgi:hypothetical protein
MTRRLLGFSPLLFWVAAGAALPACHSTTEAPMDADFVTCIGEARATPYQPGMQVTSKNGTFIVKLIKNTFTDSSGIAQDESFVKGYDVWTVETDQGTSMTPLDGLSIKVLPYMPDHKHGTTPVGVMAAGSPGVYTMSPVNLYMAGYWEVTFNIVQTPAPADTDADGGADAAASAPISDSAVLKICVPD